MLQSLLALPLGALTEVLVFLALYALSPLSGKQVALLVGLVSLCAVVLYSLINWPGADVLAMYIAVLAVSAYLLAIISSNYEERRAERTAKRRWFHWAPTVIVVFFLALFALDGVLVSISTQGLPAPFARVLLPPTVANDHVQSVFPGTVANNFQKKEDQYNAYLAQVKRQQERGWKLDKGWLKKPVEGEPAVFQLRVLEADDAPVRFAQVGGVFLRPSDSRKDTVFAMQEIQPGLYQAVLTLPQPGMWDLLLTVKRGGQLHELRASTSVSAKAP